MTNLLLTIHLPKRFLEILINYNASHNYHTKHRLEWYEKVDRDKYIYEEDIKIHIIPQLYFN